MTRRNNVHAVSILIGLRMYSTARLVRRFCQSSFPCMARSAVYPTASAGCTRRCKAGNRTVALLHVASAHACIPPLGAGSVYLARTITTFIMYPVKLVGWSLISTTHIAHVTLADHQMIWYAVKCKLISLLCSILDRVYAYNGTSLRIQVQFRLPRSFSG